MTWIGFSTVALLALGLGVVLLTRRGMSWGASLAEQAAVMPGDAYFDGRLRARIAMTRAVTIDAQPEDTWPWLAQIGRGAGWYSYDRLDNGGLASARRVVSWIPPPAVGDATAIGYLRHVHLGQELTWWAPGVRFLGSSARLTVDIQLRAQPAGSRVVIRMSADAAGFMAWPALCAFAVMDSIMAIKQLRGIRDRVHRAAVGCYVSEAPETGARDQYQHYEVLYAAGEGAGRAGVEHARRWRQAAISDGVLAAGS